MEKTIDERGVAKLWGKVKEYVEREGDSGSHTHDDRYYTEEEIDVKMKEQQNQIDIVRNNTADAFDETKTYAVGNYCIYNNVLYKCKTAVTEAGPWNEDNWAITTVEAEISELKTTMEGEISELNSKLIKRKIYHRAVNGDYHIFRHSELGLTEHTCIVNVNIPRMPDYTYRFVIGFGIDIDKNVFVYFDGPINCSNVEFYLYYYQLTN